MFVCCECCVLSGTGLCDGLITRPEESYWLWRVVCDQETSKMRRLKPATGLWKYNQRGCNARKTNKLAFYNKILNSFWGESSNSGKIFTLQKKIIRILAATQHKNFCRSLFKKLKILPVPCQYILLFMNFITNNQEILQKNSSMNNINTKNKHHLHKPHANLSCFQKSTFYAGITIFTAVCHLVWQSPRMTRQNLKQP